MLTEDPNHRHLRAVIDAWKIIDAGFTTVRDTGGTSVVTVVIDEAGDRLVGSSIVEGGRAYAVGRAVWAALFSR